MPRVLRFFWQMPDSPYTTAEWLCVPFVLVMHLILGFPFFIYGLLGMPSRAQQKFHAEHDQRARREWQQREALRRRERVLTGAAVDALLDPPRGCFLHQISFTSQLWWVDEEPTTFPNHSQLDPVPPEGLLASSQNLYRELLSEEHGRALLLEFPNHQSEFAFRQRIPPERERNISQPQADEEVPGLFCFKQPTDEEFVQLFPEAESSEVIKREDKPFWGRYWQRIGIGNAALLLILVLPLLPLVVVLPVEDWLAVGVSWLGANVGLGMLLMVWETRGEFWRQHEQSWWRPLLRWGMPSLVAGGMYVAPFGLCYEAGYPERYLLCLALHLAAYTLWRWLMPRWYDPFAKEFEPPLADEEELARALQAAEAEA